MFQKDKSLSEWTHVLETDLKACWTKVMFYHYKAEEEEGVAELELAQAVKLLKTRPSWLRTTSK